MDKHELISGILDAFTRAVSEALSETGPEDIRLDWSLTPAPQENAETWTWWSGGLSTHPGANFFVGAPEETWEKLGRGGQFREYAGECLRADQPLFCKSGRRAVRKSGGGPGRRPVRRSFRRLDPDLHRDPLFRRAVAERRLRPQPGIRRGAHVGEDRSGEGGAGRRAGSSPPAGRTRATCSCTSRYPCRFPSARPKSA